MRIGSYSSQHLNYTQYNSQRDQSSVDRGGQPNIRSMQPRFSPEPAHSFALSNRPQKAAEENSVFGTAEHIGNQSRSRGGGIAPPKGRFVDIYV